MKRGDGGLKRRRHWTQAQDEQILACSRGEVTLGSLVFGLNSSYRAIRLRAADLNVILPVVRKRPSPMKKNQIVSKLTPSDPGITSNDIITVGRQDRLLKMLFKVHGSERAKVNA